MGKPERGDIVVFRWPVNPRLDYIKRVVGLPGDRIRYQNKTLFINGNPAPIEPVGQYQPRARVCGHWARSRAGRRSGDVQHAVLVNPLASDFSPSCGSSATGGRVPGGHYLMVGDNRDDSNDGRCWGFVPEENLVGKAFFVWLSWDWQRSGFLAPVGSVP